MPKNLCFWWNDIPTSKLSGRQTILCRRIWILHEKKAQLLPFRRKFQISIICSTFWITPSSNVTNEKNQTVGLGSIKLMFGFHEIILNYNKRADFLPWSQKEGMYRVFLSSYCEWSIVKLRLKIKISRTELSWQMRERIKIFTGKWF